jgi:predicted RNA binding protein YcfA (HicA-like mRNA interferase family)
MSKVPSLPYFKVVKALQRDGWVFLRQRGTSHIQMQKHSGDRVMRLTIPAHRPLKRPILADLLKQAGLDVDRFLELL